MESKGKMGADISVQIDRPIIYKPRFVVESIYDVEHWRAGHMLSKTQDRNICTDEGLNALLDIMFDAGTQITAWYVFLYTGSAVIAGSTYAVPTCTESILNDEAVGGSRVAYDPAPASGKSMTNSASKAVFTISDTVTIIGAALVGGGTAASTPQDAAGGGTLYCGSNFGASKACVDNDVLNVTITLTAADV